MLATCVASYFIAATAAAAELCFNLTGREALPTLRLAKKEMDMQMEIEMKDEQLEESHDEAAVA